MNRSFKTPPGVIQIKDKPPAAAHPKPWCSTDEVEEVSGNDAAIERAARRYLLDPGQNIEAGVYILAQIWCRTEDPTVEKAATLCNPLGATEVNSYGKTAARHLMQKPWAKAKQAD